MRLIKTIVLTGLIASPSLAEDVPAVLVFSHTAGFRHACIESATQSLQSLGGDAFTCEFTEDPAEFTPGNLSRFDAVVFQNTTQDVLNDVQQEAFEAYLRNGGGYVGIHAAADTEYEWPFYGTLLGGAWFKTHPAVQEATIIVEDLHHPSMAHLPREWVRTDEWYEYRANPRAHVHVLASLDESTYDVAEGMGDHPIAWTVPVGKGAAFYTGGGHTEESFEEPGFREHLRQGILWAMNDGWIELIPETGKRGWRGAEKWTKVTDVKLDVDNPVGIQSTPAGDEEPAGLIVNQNGASSLMTDTDFGDIELHVEFMIPKGGNSGVYLQERYELQILDSWGKSNPGSGDCGGVYQRWDPSRKPEGYEGHPPLVNASRKPGHWQSYDIVFRAPRFDDSGKKIANARFDEVYLNGILVQKDIELTGPTRGGREGPEAAMAPIMFQGDHGPVAYRNIRVRRIGPPESAE